MKVLLIDDDGNRVRKIEEYVCSKTPLPSEEIIVVASVTEARRVLKAQQVDLLLLDILIPQRAGDTPSSEASLRLLTEISETEILNKPRKVIGLTAYEDVAKIASPAFVEQAWTIIETNEISEDWLLRIVKCVEYMLSQSAQDVRRRYEIDVLVVTALRNPEMHAVRSLPWAWSSEEPFDDANFICRGSLESNGHALSAVSAVSDRMGMVATAVLASKLLARYKPRLCVMPGICAGVKGRSDIGDVIFADTCWDYQSGKFGVDDSGAARFEIDPHQIAVDAAVSSRIDQLAGDDTEIHRIWKGWPTRPGTQPKLIRGPVASGSAVLADQASVERIIQQQRKVCGIEMELYGLYVAAEQCASPQPLTFGLKAVCDLADASKADQHQSYAAYMSAQVMHSFLARFGSDLAAIAERR